MKPVIRYEIQVVELLIRQLMPEAKRLLQTNTTPLVTKQYINRARYCIIKFKHEGDVVKYGILFKKQRIHSFSKIYPDEKGEGESVNVYDFKRHFNDCHKGGIIYIYQNTWESECYIDKSNDK